MLSSNPEEEKLPPPYVLGQRVILSQTLAPEDFFCSFSTPFPTPHTFNYATIMFHTCIQQMSLLTPLLPYNSLT